MSFNLKSLVWMAFGASVAAGAALTMASPALAQTLGADPLEGFRTQDSSTDPFSGSGDGQMRGLFNLIHRSTLGNPASFSDFNRQQRESLDTEASDFRSRQLEMLRQPSQFEWSTPPASTPADN